MTEVYALIGLLLGMVIGHIAALWLAIKRMSKYD